MKTESCLLFSLRNLFYVGMVLLFSCSQPVKTVQKETKTNSPSFSIIKKHKGTKDTLFYSCTYSFSRSPYGIGVYTLPDTIRFEKFSLAGNSQKSLFSFPFINPGFLLGVDSIRIRDTFYLSLIHANPRKSPKNTLVISLWNPENKRIYSLRYHYYQAYTSLAAKYQADDSMKRYPLQVQALQKRAAEFALTAHPNNFKKENDSLVKRWVMLNDRVYEETATQGHSFQLNSEETQGDLTPGILNYEFNDSLFKSHVSLAENGNYKITAMVKGPVIGFNKAQKRSFLLWVPDEPDHYIKTIQLRGNKVLFFDSLLGPKSKLKPTYEYDLGMKIVKKLK